MQLKLLLALILCTAFYLQSYAQSGPVKQLLELRFSPVLDGKPLVISNAVSVGEAADSDITLLRCYISGIRLTNGAKTVWEESNSYHLLDASEPGTMVLKLNVPRGISYSHLHFNLGIDSTTSSSGAHGGDLDPAKGMYWAWQSGYINFKLEGYSPRSGGRKHAFQYHLGGYQERYLAMQPVRLAVRPGDSLLVNMDISQFMSGIDLAKQHSIMIPGEEAVQLSKAAANIFSIQ